MKKCTTVPVIVDCTIDKKIYINFNKFHRFYSQRNTWNIILFPVVLLGLAIYNWRLGNNILAWILLAACLIIPIWSLFIFHFKTQKQVKQFNLTIPRVFYSLAFNENGINISNKKEHVDYKWSQVYKVYRTQTSFYLYITPANAFIIPFECVKSCTTDELWILFQNHITENKLITKRVIYEK